MSSLTRPKIFAPFAEIVAALHGRQPGQPYQGSIRAKTGVPEISANKDQLAKDLGFDPAKFALPQLEHKDVILQIKENYELAAADGLTTDRIGWLIGVAMADCLAILIYDPSHKAAMAIHSGWRGSKANITGQGVDLMSGLYDSNPAELRVYVGPGACGKCYEVENDVYEQFNPKYFAQKTETKWLFDNQAVVRDQLFAHGINDANLEIDHRCTMEDPELLSARRDKDDNLRNVAVIGLKP